MLLLDDQPLQALEALLLLQTVSKRLQDHAKAVSSSCQLTQLLLNLGCPRYAQVSAGLLSPRGQIALKAHLSLRRFDCSALA